MNFYLKIFLSLLLISPSFATEFPIEVEPSFPDQTIRFAMETDPLQATYMIWVEDTDSDKKERKFMISAADSKAWLASARAYTNFKELNLGDGKQIDLEIDGKVIRLDINANNFVHEVHVGEEKTFFLHETFPPPYLAVLTCENLKRSIKFSVLQSQTNPKLAGLIIDKGVERLDSSTGITANYIREFYLNAYLEWDKEQLKKISLIKPSSETAGDEKKKIALEEIAVVTYKGKKSTLTYQKLPYDCKIIKKPADKK